MSRFAWQTFAALNWPARLGDERGVPDPNNRFADTSGPTIWATWKSLDDLYPEEGSPTPWSTRDDAPTVSVFDGRGGRKQFRMPRQEGAGRVKALGRLTGVNQAFVRASKDEGSPLVCQNGKLVRYEVRVNKVAYDYIFDNKYYRRDVLNTLGKNAGVFPYGAINVKAAWKELPPDPALRARYYHTAADVLVGWKKVGGADEAVTERRVVGLVGLHVVYRVNTRDSWVWSTFEQVDNVDVPPGAAVASFRDPNGTGEGNTPKHTPITPGSAIPTKPVQVKRVADIHPTAGGVNAEFRQHPWFERTPWRYYQLVGVQWVRAKAADGTLTDPGVPPAKDGRLPKDEPPGRGMLANVTMETFLQNSSCLACHGPNRQERKFPFVFYPDFMAVPPLPPSP